MTTRRTVLKTMAAGALTLPLPMRAFAAAWPERPVTILVPFSPGGVTDGVARLTAQVLGEKMGQSFVVENKVGAGGAIAATAAARAAPDGYTMFMAALPQLAVLPAMRKTPYDPAADFAPVSNVASSPFVLIANKDFAPKTLQDFVAYVKARRGKLNYASGGTGTLSHLTMVLFLSRAGLDMTHVPYKGGAPAVLDVLAGTVPVYFGNLADALPHAKDGSVRLLAVSGTQRYKGLPEVPTIAESGFPGFRSETWNGLVAPAKTPKTVVDAVARGVAAAAQQSKFIAQLANLGADPIGSTPERFAATIKADIAQWGQVVRQANIAAR